MKWNKYQMIPLCFMYMHTHTHTFVTLLTYCQIALQKNWTNLEFQQWKNARQSIRKNISDEVGISISHQKITYTFPSCHGDIKRLHLDLPFFSGVGIGVVHAGYERRLAHHLGAHSTPSILGIVNGKISFFHNAVVRENLRQFVESLLPGNLVEKVSTCQGKHDWEVV